MQIIINGANTEVEPDTTVASLAHIYALGRGPAAVAVDEQVVPRSAWTTTTIHQGARVELLTATAGG